MGNEISLPHSTKGIYFQEKNNVFYLIIDLSYFLIFLEPNQKDKLLPFFWKNSKNIKFNKIFDLLENPNFKLKFIRSIAHINTIKEAYQRCDIKIFKEVLENLLRLIDIVKKEWTQPSVKKIKIKIKK